MNAPLGRGKIVAAVGGRDAVGDGALLNSGCAERVYLLYRGARLDRPDPITIARLEDTPNQGAFETEFVELLGEDGLPAARLSPPTGGKQLALRNLFI